MDGSRWFLSYWRWPHALMRQRDRSHRRPFPRRPTGTRMGAWICEALALVRSAEPVRIAGTPLWISPENLAQRALLVHFLAPCCARRTLPGRFTPLADPFRGLMASVGAIGCADRHYRRRDTPALDHHPRRPACSGEGHILQRSDLAVPHAMTPGVFARTAGADLGHLLDAMAKVSAAGPAQQRAPLR